MDPISVSCLTLNGEENAKAIEAEQKRDAKFEQVIGSCKSLSRYEGKTFKTVLPQVTATLMAVSLHVAVGLSMSFSGILIPALDKVRLNGTDDDGNLYATEAESAWIASLVVIAVPFGSMTSGFLADIWGRLWTVKVSVIPFVLGWCLIATAQSIPQILIGRFLTGFATPWSSIPATVYVSEIARADMRGSLIVTAPTLTSAGMLILYLKGWFLHWRTVAWLCNAYVLLPVLLVFLIPESPPWLISKGRIDEAAKSLRWFNRYQPQPDNRNESMAELQLQALQAEHQKQLESQATNLGLLGVIKEFMKPTAYKPLILLTGLFVFQMFSGIYITLFYSVTFFEAVGTKVNPYLASTLICLIRMIMAFSNSYLLKTFKRRTLLMMSGFGMSICMVFSGLSTYWIKTGTSNQTFLPVVFMLLYIFTSIGMLCIPWTMMCELFPLEIRGVANSLAYSIGNLIIFASVQSFYGLLSIFQGYAGIQWFFAVISILGSIYAYIFLPETHNKKLTEISAYFEDNFIYILSKNKKPKQKKYSTKNRFGKKTIVKTVENGQDEKLLQL
ncbi:facilitated trehalose transporter Tret1-2 homolog isoform X2 [Diorhabda sublineata]|nr:facilitated trehalose transporter Tret1-2 homolog isoform X2 [Diorhabda sublineata]XP_056639920.1 facilitated trehalose transporter Tret1-2 homolog isoform X2 [Diorhabda sublineata]XP_056639921.1 facilitated trehalose transporter Tret1-2 homolog isoform X2 [Diorhabda sublineata]